MMYSPVLHLLSGATKLPEIKSRSVVKGGWANPVAIIIILRPALRRVVRCGLCMFCRLLWKSREEHWIVWVANLLRSALIVSLIVGLRPT